MNDSNSNKPSRTDWARVDAMTDDEIDLSDSPALGEEFFANAQWRMPEGKKPVLLSVDTEVLEWFEEQGSEFQYRINAALKIYADAHRQ